jgi:hypothetical protein
MGHDISPIGNHKLNTKDIKFLAEDISSRIDINIEYGFYGLKEHFKLLGENRNDEYIVLGKIIKDKKFKTFRLIDEHYQLKQLHGKFGNNLFHNPEYWIYYEGKIPEDKIIEEQKKELIFPDFQLTSMSKNETEYLNIYKELYSNDIPYFSRWWSFCSLFTDSNFDNFEYLAELLTFRKELMKYTFAFGGEKIYYLDDQSNVLEGLGQGSEWEYSWNDFEQFVAEKTLPLLLNIPQFLTNRNYRNEFIEKKEYPLSFVDDFSDIK